MSRSEQTFAAADGAELSRFLIDALTAGLQFFVFKAGA
jgi:hypothetical protein